MAKVIFEVEIRDKDIDGNKIDVMKDIELISNEIEKFWNVESLNWKIKK